MLSLAVSSLFFAWGWRRCHKVSDGLLLFSLKLNSSAENVHLMPSLLIFLAMSFKYLLAWKLIFFEMLRLLYYVYALCDSYLIFHGH